MDDRDPEQRLDVHVVRVRLERIPEEDDEVDPPFDNARADLLIAAERAAQKAGDLQSELLTEQSPCRSRRVELVARERVAIEPRPREQRGLAVVVGDERNPLSR